MKNILILVPHLGRGGMERMAVRTAELLKTRCNLAVMVFEEVENPYPVSAKVINLNRRMHSNYAVKLYTALARIRDLRRYEKENQIDICFSFGDVANIINAYGWEKTRRVCSVRGYASVPRSTEWLKKTIFSHCFKRSDLVYGVSRQIAKDLATVTGLPCEKFETLHNCYDVEAIVRASTEACALKPHFPTLVALGRLEPPKGLDCLLHAFADVAKSFPAARLVFVGGGGLHAGLKVLAGQLGIAENVVFAGLQQNPYAFLSRADVFVLTSRSEGFPNAMVEAMACGLPVISADCKSGPREILAPDTAGVAAGIEMAQYGILLPPVEDVAFGAKFLQAARALLEDEKLRESYQQAARTRAADFSPEAYIKRLESDFIKLLEN